MNKVDFPIFQTMPQLIYLDNAATTQKPKAMLEASEHYYRALNANVHRGIYDLSEEATAAYENARATVANFIHAQKEEIVFTSGTTMGLNLLARMLICDQDAGKTIITTEMEHHSNFLPWQKVAQENHLQLELLSVSAPNWQLNLAELEKILTTQNVRLLTFSLMSNVTGVIPDYHSMISLCRKLSPQTLIVIDAAQAIAHLEIDVQKIDGDFLVFSGHKLYGPTAIGVLYGKNRLLQNLEPALLGGGMIREVTRTNCTFTSSPEKFEAGTPPIAEAIALAASIKYLEELSWEKILKQEKHLVEFMQQQVWPKELQAFFSTTTNQGPVFSFAHKHVHAHDLAAYLNQQKIAVRAGHHCAQILVRDILQVPSTIRVSCAIYNSLDDLQAFIQALNHIPSYLIK